jgi:soluble lytic murein transglycosylase
MNAALRRNGSPRVWVLFLAGCAFSAWAQSESASSRIDPAIDNEDEVGFELRAGTGPVRLDPEGNHKLERKDIESYFAHGQLAQAKAEFDKRRFPAARKLLDKLPPSRPVRYLRALCDAKLLRHEAAATELTSLAEEWQPLRNHLLFQAGNELERASKQEQASVRYRGISQDALEYPFARIGIARALEARKDFAGASDILQSLVVPGSDAPPVVQADAWTMLSRVAQARKDAPGESRADFSVWALHPTSARAAAIQKRLGKKDIPPQWRVLRAETLISMHLNVQAQTLLHPLLPQLQLPDPLACRAHFANGMAYRKERKHSKAIESLRPVVEQCPDAELKPRALYVLGYSESVIDPVAAVETYDRLARDYPTHPYADDALFFAAEQELWRGNDNGAIKLLARLARDYPRGNFTADALFKRFWIARANGRFAEGMDALTDIENLRGSGASHDQVQRARYWRSRLLLAVGRRDDSTKLLESVAEEGAATYYGLLARSRLAQEGTKAPRPEGPVESQEVWPLGAGSLWEDPHFRAGIELARLEHPHAASELLAVNRRNQPEESFRLLIHILDESGHSRPATQLARAFLREGFSGPSQVEARRIYEVAYPHAYRSLVEQHSRAAQINPDLMQALIREESAFNPRARSSTGAIGLAQLMPTTARRVARSLRGPRVTDRSLLDPRQNIRLGSAYLGDLARRFDGNFAYAVASYNAGPNAVRRWLKKNPTAELDEWVEEIPVAETRNYVKRVLGSYVTYELLYAQGEPSILALTQPSGGGATAAAAVP